MRLALKFALVLLCANSALAETTIDLPIPEARALATQAALGGDPETARRIAAQLLQLDPNDRAALLVLAAVEPQLGRPAQGRLAGARAYAVSATDAEKYEAARLTALAAANEGRFTLAGWWLRRALTVAPTPQDAEQTTADARGVRNLNPWSSNVALSFAPSDNVNGGANAEFFTFPGSSVAGQRLSPSARALSGWAGVLDLKTRYRFAVSQVAQSSLSARIFARRVILSENAWDFIDEVSLPNDAPVELSEFSSSLLEFSFRHDRAAQRGVYGFDVILGQVWSQAEFDYTFLRVGADRTVPVTDNASLSFAGSIEHRLDDDDQPKDWRYQLRGTASYELASGNALSATLGLAMVDSDRANDVSYSRSLQLNYAIARPIGPAKVQFSLGASGEDFPDYAFLSGFGFIPVIGGREDRRVFGSAELFFADFDSAGFAPVVTLSASRTQSNVSRFDRDDLSLSFSFRSTF